MTHPEKERALKNGLDFGQLFFMGSIGKERGKQDNFSIVSSAVAFSRGMKESEFRERLKMMFKQIVVELEASFLVSFDED